MKMHRFGQKCWPWVWVARDFFASIIVIFVSSINRLAKTTLVGWEKGTCGGRKSMLVGEKASWWVGKVEHFRQWEGSPHPPSTRENPDSARRPTGFSARRFKPISNIVPTLSCPLFIPKNYKEKRKQAWKNLSHHWKTSHMDELRTKTLVSLLMR